MPFDPTTISGLQFWLKGDAGVYSDLAGTVPVTPGTIGTVQRWSDQSGNGLKATESSQRPSYIAAVSVDGLLPALQNGALKSNFTVTAPYTIFVVAKMVTGDVTGNHRIFQGETNNWLIGPRGGFLAHYAVTGFVASTSGPSMVAGTIYRCYTTNSGSASHFAVDGTDITQSTTPVGVAGQIDYNFFGSTNEPFGGLACELLIYNSVLSAPDLASVDGYLSARWQTAAATGPRKLAGPGGLAGPYSHLAG